MNSHKAQPLRDQPRKKRPSIPVTGTGWGIAVLERGTLRMLECNQEFEQLIGRRCAETRGLPVHDFLVPENPPSLAALKSNLDLMSGNETRLTVTRPDGEAIAVQVQSRAYELGGRPVIHTLWRASSMFELEPIASDESADESDCAPKSIERNQPDQWDLQTLLAKTYALTGELFFETLVQELACLLAVEHVAVARFSDPSRSRLDYIAYSANGKLQTKRSIEIANTPELEVVQKGQFGVSFELPARKPLDPKVKEFGLNSFAGIALRDDNGEVIGCLSAFSTKEHFDSDRAIQTLSFLGERLSTELERLDREERIQELLATRASLIDLLLASIVPKTLSEKLDDSLRMISSVRIASIPHAGAIYLHDEGLSELRLAARQSLNAMELAESNRCAQEWFRQYGCGEESDATDAPKGITRSDFTKSETYFLIPIQSQSVTYGLLTLQRVGRRIESGVERNFFRAAASTLAGMLERERSKKALDEAETKVLRSQRLEAVGQLAGGIAHDFNNLLTAILGNAELLNKNVPGLSELSSIRRAGESASRLTSQLLAFTRKQVLKPERIDVGKAVEDVAKMLERIIPESITLKISACPCLYYTIADAGQLQQVLMNLVINARDAMPAGGLLGVRTELVTLTNAANELSIPPGSYIQISVTDSGIGIDSNSIQRIYEPFYTTKLPTQGSAREGTGLGLSVVYGIVKQHGGYIDVTSVPGRGTEFRIFLAADTAPVVATRSPEKLSVLSVEGTASILIVEDQEEVREIAARLLSSLGYDVSTASGGPEALAMFSDPEYCVDVVLLDVVMPVMSGIEAFDKLRKIRPEQRVVFMTGHDPTASLRNVLSAERAAVLHKPFTRHELGESIRSLMVQN